MNEANIDVLTDEQIGFQLILHSGNARSKVLEALRQSRQGDEARAAALLKEAEEDLNRAHHIHFQMIQREASDEKIEFSLILMHAEDHLMSTLTMKELVKELIEWGKQRL
jgi:PTS system cellobiose-specific IIA component